MTITTKIRQALRSRRTPRIAPADLTALADRYRRLGLAKCLEHAEARGARR